MKAIIKERSPREQKRGDENVEVYDFFFGGDSKGKFFEGRPKVDLQKYNIEKL